MKDNLIEDLCRIAFDAELDECPNCGSSEDLEIIHPGVKVCKKCLLDEVKKIVIEQVAHSSSTT